jgi:hypothetical protein
VEEEGEEGGEKVVEEVEGVQIQAEAETKLFIRYQGYDLFEYKLTSCSNSKEIFVSYLLSAKTKTFTFRVYQSTCVSCVYLYTP